MLIELVLLDIATSLYSMRLPCINTLKHDLGTVCLNVVYAAFIRLPKTKKSKVCHRDIGVLCLNGDDCKSLTIEEQDCRRVYF